MKFFKTLVLLLSVNSAFAQYCATSNTFGDFRSIGGVVTTGGVTNINNGPATNLSGVNNNGQPSYRDYTAHKVSQFAGGNINFQLWTTQLLQGGGVYSQTFDQYYYVWVDWNGDNDFTDPGEYMNINPASVLPNVTPLFINANGTGNGVMTVPATATPGNKRMRIRSNEVMYTAMLPGSPALATCGNVGNRGETEDYTLEVIAATCNVVPGTITSNLGTFACVSGSPVLTLTGASTGGNVSYQWRSSTDGINWSNVGTNSTTYNAGPVNATVFYKVITSCTALVGDVDSTPVFTFSIYPNVAPAVTIVSNATTLTCAGTPVIFTATPVNGGTTPAYQWKKNGANVGGNANTYTDNTLATTDIVTVEMTSNAPCALPASVTSNPISIVITPTLLPQATVQSNTGNVICAGTAVFFNALLVNEGAAPSYQWKVNGSNVGSNAPQYSTNSLANGDIVTVELTSNAICALPSIVTSTPYTMTVNPILTPVVSVNQTPAGTICEGTAVVFNEVSINPGATPLYTWFKNGISVGTGHTYSDNTLRDGDKITLTLVSNVACATITTAHSSQHVVDVISRPNPSISIASNFGDDAFSRRSVTFTATYTNAGRFPVFYWYKNGALLQGATGASYKADDLLEGDIIECVVQCDFHCLPNLARSNRMVTTSATSLAGVGSLEGISVYPNPNNGHFTIKADLMDASVLELQLTNMIGQVAYVETVAVNGTSLVKSVNVAELLGGVYVLRLTQGAKTYTNRIVIK